MVVMGPRVRGDDIELPNPLPRRIAPRAISATFLTPLPLRVTSQNANLEDTHETPDDPERSQPQSSGGAGAAYLRDDHAGADQGKLRAACGAAQTHAVVSSVEPRGRAGRFDPVGAAGRGRHHHQSGRLFL